MTSSEVMQLYDQKGAPFVGGVSYYRDTRGKLLRVPSMFGPKSQVMTYLETCFEKRIGLEIKEEELRGALEEFWTRGEETMAKIMEMLARREQELKETKSIRALLYGEVAKILSKLTIPIFTRQQLEQIPNISRPIIDEIDAILVSSI